MSDYLTNMRALADCSGLANQATLANPWQALAASNACELRHRLLHVLSATCDTESTSGPMIAATLAASGLSISLRQVQRACRALYRAGLLVKCKGGWKCIAFAPRKLCGNYRNVALRAWHYLAEEQHTIPLGLAIPPVAYRVVSIVPIVNKPENCEGLT